ncbi:hypothetical protein H8356DRAFT_1433378 [Neocallimastix lanati (nom. inval.)]|nr:hypothetical protein H8356DRAFT_1433378 [Neocallimastix sp. JGI-2020a]
MKNNDKQKNNIEICYAKLVKTLPNLSQIITTGCSIQRIRSPVSTHYNTCIIVHFIINLSIKYFYHQNQPMKYITLFILELLNLFQNFKVIKTLSFLIIELNEKSENTSENLRRVITTGCSHQFIRLGRRSMTPTHDYIGRGNEVEPFYLDHSSNSLKEMKYI